MQVTPRPTPNVKAKTPQMYKLQIGVLESRLMVRLLLALVGIRLVYPEQANFRWRFGLVWRGRASNAVRYPAGSGNEE
jgi:hypothetical protein